MNRESIIQAGIRWVLVVLPTILIGWVTLKFLNISYTSLDTGIVKQTLAFGIGLTAGYLLYHFRARWVITLFLLWVAYWIAERIIARLPGEFDVFYTTARFQLYSTLFVTGWIFGLLLVRLRWSAILIAGIFLAATVAAVSATVDISFSYVAFHLAPVLVYGLYMLFVLPELRQPVEVSWKKAGRWTMRLAGFVLLIFLALLITDWLFRGDLKAVEKELAARGAKDAETPEGDKGYDERYGLMERKDNAFKLKDTMRVNSRMSQSDQLMFCSKLDSYFPDGNTPMPLYFVYHYLTRYDQQRESFVRDPSAPFLDELDVDPTSLTLYDRATDSTVIRNALGTKLRKLVNADVYLSSNTWKHALLGPSSVFSVQSIPVERDFQKTFLSAYRTKAYASELNNAFFVYNVSVNPFLEAFQEDRHAELRNVSSYQQVDPDFYKYYTIYPEGPVYDSIARLAREIAADAVYPVDKVLAVRDHFLQRGPTGKRIFRYTLKAGAVDDPNIPSSQMLYNFLFRTHAGYCTYYAGASYFMLRALGIPTRFTTGFATINRSDKNKGWYWFYASQAHAWTQVYFPGYGWMDFDMTIGNEDQQGAPKPDGTPPLPPPEPWLVLNAINDEPVDMIGKRLKVSYERLIYFNENYKLSKPVSSVIDASLCRVVYGEKDTTLQVIRPGDSIVVVSYKDDAKKIPQPRKGVSIDRQVQDFPTPLIADEIHVKPREKPVPPEQQTAKRKQEEKPITAGEILAMIAKTLGVALVAILLFPLLYLLYRQIRVSMAGDLVQKADMIYFSALYRLHMAGIQRDNETPMEYAYSRVDPVLQAGFESFMKVYLRLKYSREGGGEDDLRHASEFHRGLGPAIRKHTGWQTLALHYLNPFWAARYFRRSERPQYETQLL